ncbi:MAG: FKBP-type peptidyl-prolyl cis-trans isomerase SlyD [Pseudomonadota bacterium]|nr:FKBP-type peptidyl-prolyl cis-trans isomerase SlyD [Pseudomonadota bacterium]
MTIQAQKVITINYTLRDQAGTIIDQSQDGSFCYLHGANNIIPGLENALSGRRQGEQFQITLQPSEAYGEYNPSLTQVVERKMFENGDEIAVGMQFHAQSDEGQFISITVVGVDGDSITIDGNPPLAGVTLYYDVSVVGIRDASLEELRHGHVHNAHHHAEDLSGGCSSKSSGGGCGGGGCGGGGCH